MLRRAQTKMPMPRQSLLLMRVFPILLVTSFVLSTHWLWAQKSPPPEEFQGGMFDRPIQLASAPEAKSHPGPASETLPDSPRSQTESLEKLFRTSSYHASINTQAALNLQQPIGTADSLGKSKYFKGSPPSQWLTSAYGKVHYQTIQPADHLQYYGHHIPWAGPTILRVSQQAKNHPHVTSVLKLFKPQF